MTETPTKSLENMKTLLDSKTNLLKKLQRQCAQLKVDIKTQESLQIFLSNNHHFTMHALLRYLDRIKGSPVEEAMQELSSEPIKEAIRLKRTRVSINGVYYVIKNNKVITCFEDGTHD